MVIGRHLRCTEYWIEPSWGSHWQLGESYTCLQWVALTDRRFSQCPAFTGKKVMPRTEV